MEVRYLSEADTPPLPLDGTGREPTPVDREEWSDALHRTLAAVLQVISTFYLMKSSFYLSRDSAKICLPSFSKKWLCRLIG